MLQKQSIHTKICLRRVALQLVLIISTTGCASVGGIDGVSNRALEMVGITKPTLPELPETQKPPRTIQLNLHAGENLNLDEHGRPLALIARIYKLKQTSGFEQASYADFLNPQRESEILGADLLEVKEITLIPGQRFHVAEKVNREASFVGIVAFFRSPANQHWRVAFPIVEAEASGITIGLHACAISIGTGLSTLKTTPTSSLSSVLCPPT
jgi:type VI secretion system protein VasD